MTAPWSTGGYLKADGKNLEYACWGPAPAETPTLVLLHEGLGSTALWRNFPANLAEATGYGVLAYSRAGYGHSDLADLPRPVDYMTKEAVDVLPEVLDAIGFERGVLVGHSDGATIAAIYAGIVTDPRVRGIVLMAPHFFTEEMGLAEIALSKVAFETGDLPQRMAKYHADAEHTFRGWNDGWLNPEFKNWNVSNVIDQIRVPILAIQGLEDQYGTLAQIEELENRSNVRVDRLVLNDCRHSPFLEKPKEVVSAVAEYCMRL